MKFITTVRSFLTIALLWTAIALLPLNSALAATVESDSADTVRQSANEVVENTGAKEQFGKSENGDQLLDRAQQKASKKLDKLADEADSNDRLPNSKKLFLDNLTDNSEN